MTTDTTPPSQTANLTVYEPFVQPGRPFLQDSVLGDMTDWELARIALDRRSSAAYHDDPRAEEARKIGKEFTAAEAQRVDAFLTTTIQDVERLNTIDDAPQPTEDDRAWLVTQLRLAWQRLDRLRDVIDDSGSLMNFGYPASAVDYVRWSRKPQAFSPCPAPGPGPIA
ncbi:MULTISPECIES: hypothetical protein [unclassified Kitasatospora]|uniref:hypothetical protein n=1 Tax=unclassified Kitasatospora TaxID=2633591 RepID=UPI0033C5FF7B